MPKSLKTQKLKYDEINWNILKAWLPSTHKNAEQFPFPLLEQNLVEEGEFKRVVVDSKPQNLASGMEGDTRKPYWTFAYTLSETSGLLITNINVRDTQTASSQESLEEVFCKISFDGFEIELDDGADNGKRIFFNLKNALQNKDSFFLYGEDGEGHVVDNKPSDKLYQRGLKLRLVDNILDSGNMDSSNYCKVQLEISIVFRGAKNDFDPGGIPVALDVFPQIAWKWFNEKGKTGARVKRFRGMIKPTVKNYMYEMNMMQKNIAGLYTDTNSALSGTSDRSGYFGVETWGASFQNLPRSWGTLFDYADINLEHEKEFIGVYSIHDKEYKALQKHRKKEKTRNGNYLWLEDYKVDVWGEMFIPVPIFGTGYWALVPVPVKETGIPFLIEKHARQGAYDNIHIHAKMMPNDYEPNEPVHAPFCGHSCVHLHWRWGPAAADGAIPKSKDKQYLGWSINKISNIDPKAPLIPPNQRLRVAITKANHIRNVVTVAPSNTNPTYNWDEDSILGGFSNNLDQKLKTIWYAIDIKWPNAGEKQVILEQGLGWAYRYTKPGETPDESEIELIVNLTQPQLRLKDPISQADMNKFFVEKIYPDIRYIEGTHKTTGTKEQYLEQIPNGNFKGGPDGQDNPKSLEDL